MVTSPSILPVMEKRQITGTTTIVSQVSSVEMRACWKRKGLKGESALERRTRIKSSSVTSIAQLYPTWLHKMIFCYQESNSKRQALQKRLWSCGWTSSPHAPLFSRSSSIYPSLTRLSPNSLATQTTITSGGSTLYSTRTLDPTSTPTNKPGPNATQSESSKPSIIAIAAGTASGVVVLLLLLSLATFLLLRSRKRRRAEIEEEEALRLQSSSSHAMLRKEFLDEEDEASVMGLESNMIGSYRKGGEGTLGYGRVERNISFENRNGNTKVETIPWMLFGAPSPYSHLDVKDGNEKSDEYLETAQCLGNTIAQGGRKLKDESISPSSVIPIKHLPFENEVQSQDPRESGLKVHELPFNQYQLQNHSSSLALNEPSTNSTHQPKGKSNPEISIPNENNSHHHLEISDDDISSISGYHPFLNKPKLHLMNPELLSLTTVNPSPSTPTQNQPPKIPPRDPERELNPFKRGREPYSSAEMHLGSQQKGSSQTLENLQQSGPYSSADYRFLSKES